MRRYALKTACKAQALLGCSFNINAVGFNVAVSRNIFHHFGNKDCQLWLLRYDRSVDINRLKALFPQQLCGFF